MHAVYAFLASLASVLARESCLAISHVKHTQNSPAITLPTPANIRYRSLISQLSTLTGIKPIRKPQATVVQTLLFLPCLTTQKLANPALVRARS